MEFHLAQADQGMDWLQFIAAVVGAIAWPIAVVTIAFLFRPQLAALLAKIRGVKIGETQVDLSEKLTELEAVAREEPAPIPAPAAEPPAAEVPAAVPEPSRPPPMPLQRPEGPKSNRDRWRPTTLPMFPEDFRTPAEQIDQDWGEIDRRLRQVTDDRGVPWAQYIPADQALAHLRREGVLNDRLHAMLQEMFLLRATASLGASTIDAYRFNNLARKIVAELDDLIGKQRRNPGLR